MYPLNRSRRSRSAYHQAVRAGMPVWQRHFAIFWDAFLTVAIGAGLFDVAQRNRLWNAQGLWILFLTLAFLIAHRWLWAPVRHASDNWPPLYRDLLIVLLVEFVLVLALLPSSAWFALLFLAMMGQVAAMSPPSRWWLPFAVILLTLASPIGLYDALAAQRWEVVVHLAAVIAWFPVLFLYVRLFFDDRHARVTLQRNLDAARAEIERMTPLLHRLDALQSREQALASVRDGMHNTLASINLRLDAVRQSIGHDPSAAAAELAELHKLVQQRLKEIASGDNECAESASLEVDRQTVSAGETDDPSQPAAETSM